MARLVVFDTLQTIRKMLLRYYAAHKRDLPWRRSRDPYAIWISEIMLQQTQVDTVVPRFIAFLQRYPSIAVLAKAPPDKVCEAWAGLGYYRRARYLHRAAQLICTEHAGQMPREVEQLLRLPGIGRYTAGAIASIAFDVAAPIVDGNVERVLARLYEQAAPRSSPVGRAFFWDRAAALVQGPHPGDLNQSMMDLGATVCTPRVPRCPTCPLVAVCAAHAHGTVHLYPAPKQRPRPTPLAVAFAYVHGSQGLWLMQRPLDSGLWGGQWELPSAAGDTAVAELAELLGVSLGAPLLQVVHLLTHRRVTASVYVVPGPVSATRLRRSPTLRPWAQPLTAPLSALARRAIEAMHKGAGATAMARRHGVC